MEVLTAEAVALRDQDQGDKAAIVYERLIAHRPNYWPAYNDLGWVFYNQGRKEEALKNFELAIAVAPIATLPLTNAGSIYLILKDRVKARELFERSLRVRPSELAMVNLGVMAYQDRKYDEALDSFKKAHDLNPRSHQIFRDIADCYEVTGKKALMVENYGRAADLLEEDLKLNPRVGSRWMRLAFYHAKANRQDRVAGDMRAAEELGVSDVPAQFLKAQTLAVLGKKEEALQIVLSCLGRGLSPVEVELSPDLQVIRSDSRYRRQTASFGADAAGATR